MGTYGPVGASTTIYTATWKCPDCTYSNFSSKPSCKRCKARRPKEEEGKEGKEGEGTEQVGEHEWREVLDPESQQMYYHNQGTGEVVWDRPEVMGPAPFATGWFGRG